MGLPELCTSDSCPLKATSSTATSLQEGNVPMLRSSKERLLERQPRSGC